jgi:hypothetical protein
MAKAWRRLWIALGVALVAVGCGLAIRFTMLFWSEPWPEPILTIDGKSYLNGAAGAGWTSLFELRDLYHSPGYQIYLRFLFAIFGSSEAVIHASKILSLLMFFATAVMLYRIGRRWFEPGVAQIAVVLFLFSACWTYYCNMIQYEVLAGFLMLLFLSMMISTEPSGSSKTASLNSIGMGLVLAFLTLIQMRYGLLVMVPVIYGAIICRKESSRVHFRQIGILCVTMIVPLAAWSLAQSLSHGRLIVVMDGSAFRFHVANNPNALGYSFPYPEVIEPSGWQFISSMPGQWLWLVGQRALYLAGIQRDIWALPPQGFGSGPIGSFSPLDMIGMAVFAVGLTLALVSIRRGKLTAEITAGILLLAGVMLPPLLIFGSKRFIVPVIPLLALFQAYAVVAIGRLVPERLPWAAITH